MSRTFAITWDYLCPFARNAHEHVVEGLRAGADWDVTFVPFSLAQVHVDKREPAVWDRDDALEASGILAFTAGLVVRDSLPDRFLDVHLSLFAARHDDGDDIRDEAVIRRALDRAGVDADHVLGLAREGGAVETLRKEHEAAVADRDVFGVPTFLSDDDAVFVRLMHRPEGNGSVAQETIERVLDLFTGWRDLNEFKRTRIPR
ncbi:MAG: DsbA family protein [Nitriliruptorales bacterium]